MDELEDAKGFHSGFQAEACEDTTSKSVDAYIL